MVAGPSEDEQPRPSEPRFDPAIPHWRAEAWVRGRWVEVCGARFDLTPHDAWAQVETIRSNGRIIVRVGGVLRSAFPAVDVRGPAFTTDGDLGPTTATSYLEDGAVHALPRGSSYVWRWGGAGPVDVSFALKGSIELDLGGATHHLESERDRYELVRLAHDGELGDIVVRALTDGTSVTDLFVYARPAE